MSIKTNLDNDETVSTKDILYISLEQSVLVENKETTINDIASVFCINPDINYGVKKLQIYKFPKQEYGQQVISVMKLIEIINKEYKNIHIVNIGEMETVVYFKNSTKKSKAISIIKAIFLFVFAFFGSAYSIMSFNIDVNTRELLTLLHEVFVGEPPFGPTIAAVAYSIGLFLGMMIFFNHGITKKLTDDPTPLQVQMRLYEQECNTAIAVNSTRHKETLDVD